ncbi:MAG: thermonuclease family protein [Burkholderiales bacterium]|nr:thermonuclease family protein [Burkholderiales bacterium]
MPSLAVLLACLVIGVTDGDTLKARCESDPEPQTITIRLAEIDAPESHQAFGNRSKRSLSDLCFKKPAEVRPVTKDRYGRTVARVACDGQDASAYQVKQGMAWAFTLYLTDPVIKELEEAARGAREGLCVAADRKLSHF